MNRIDAGTVARFREAVAQLPEQSQAVFRLHVVEGLDYATVAGLLRTDMEEVERLLADAIVAIGRALRGPDDP